MDNNVTLEEKIYESYINIRKKILEYDDNKYDNLDSCIHSADFKKGFVSGVKLMLTMLIDENK